MDTGAPIPTPIHWRPDATTTQGGLCTGKLLLAKTIVPPSERTPLQVQYCCVCVCVCVCTHMSVSQKAHVLEAARRLKPLEHSVTESIRIPGKF